ncbi:response regulator [Pedobacter polaris]|uniref:Response regulator n=1 Tax=Pedobacter polaris TaxID=2571273 RepID=A0A4V5P0V1_9SPHI|nr:response regulator [Pedobacter polaris]TKC06706.1 response regulator [Pedobacter polaris]
MTEPALILLVEDSEGDILLTTEALVEGRINSKLFVVKDGWEAIQYLEKKGKYSNSITPDLVLLDVNLPKINGHEVLKFIKSKENLKHIPVVMLTTSSSEKDIMNSYQNNVNCYITKPVDSEEFIRAIASIKDFWISVVQLPKV